MLYFTAEADSKRTGRRLGEIEGRFRDLRPFFRLEAEIARDKFARQFDTEGRQDVGGWKPLSPRYAAWKQKQTGSGPILDLTGAMRKSFGEAGDPYHVEHITRTRLEVGSDHPLGRIHHEGIVSDSGRRLPSRPIIVYRRAELREIGDRLLAYLVDRRSARSRVTA